MKKIISFLLPIIILAGAIYLFKSQKNNDSILGMFTNNSLSTKEISNYLKTEKSGFSTYWFEAEPEKIKLIPNFETPLTAAEARVEYGCKNLINGGYYTKDGRPLGLFINDEGVLENWHKSSLVNGLFSINYLETPRIVREEPRDVLRIATQAGPLLKENGTFLNVSSSEDKARRSVVFTTGENKLYFAIIFDPDSQFLGPALSQLPGVLEEFENQSGIVIADALNMDGGSTSSFYSSDRSMSEITFSGSFFCEQE